MGNEAWYHGTPHEFDAFDGKHLGKGNDQLGSGFYFTDKLDTANGYAHTSDGAGGRVLVVDLFLVQPLEMDARFSEYEIEAMLRSSPDFNSMLANWGEVGFEPEPVVVARAVSAYRELNESSNDALDVLNTISNDFWSGCEAEFLLSVRKITGYDGVVRSYINEKHAVAWFPEQIEILEVREIPAPVSPGL